MSYYSTKVKNMWEQNICTRYMYLLLCIYVYNTCTWYMYLLLYIYVLLCIYYYVYISRYQRELIIYCNMNFYFSNPESILTLACVYVPGLYLYGILVYALVNMILNIYTYSTFHMSGCCTFSWMSSYTVVLVDERGTEKISYIYMT